MSSQISSLPENILKTLAYADIFDYPLTLDELVKFLIGKSEVKKKDLLNSLTKMITNSKKIYTDGEFYCLSKRKNLIPSRVKKRKWSKEKLKIAQKTAAKLQLLPWIKMVGITGALAMENCQKEDDIDLLVITSADSLWITRLLTILLSPFLGIKRRKPKEKYPKDKICFNLFLEENHLKIQPQDLFTAHEICQVKPLFNKDQTYEKFLLENKWVKKFLPNAFGCLLLEKNSPIFSPDFRARIKNLFLKIFNKISFALQYWYMKPKITQEKVSYSQAFFHPENQRKKILSLYQEKIRQLGLDKV